MEDEWPDEATSVTRLLGLKLLLEGLTPDERDDFRAYMVGYLALSADHDAWGCALAGAIALHNERQNRMAVTRIYGHDEPPASSF